VSRASGGEIRRVQAYDSHRNEIPSRAKRLIALSKFSAGLELGTVPNMFSMVPLAQSRHAPIAALRKSDGLRGAQFSQQNAGLTERLQVGSRARYRISDKAAEHALAVHHLSIEHRTLRFARELRDTHESP
jgi:hypothetical protein